MIGQTHGGKGSRDRTTNKKQYDACPLWENLKKDKNKKIFIDERDDIPQEVFEQIVMKKEQGE